MCKYVLKHFLNPRAFLSLPNLLYASLFISLSFPLLTQPLFPYLPPLASSFPLSQLSSLPLSYSLSSILTLPSPSPLTLPSLLPHRLPSPPLPSPSPLTLPSPSPLTLPSPPSSEDLHRQCAADASLRAAVEQAMYHMQPAVTDALKRHGTQPHSTFAIGEIVRHAVRQILALVVPDTGGWGRTGRGRLGRWVWPGNRAQDLPSYLLKLF